jgi:ArsR family transcriptional regulator
MAGSRTDPERGRPVSARTAELASPFGPTGLPRQAAEDLAGVMKALGDPARLMMLSLLRHHDPDGLHVMQITALVGYLSQPTVSHHLGVLVAAGMVDRAKHGPFVVHRLNTDRVAAVAALLRPPGGRK